MNQQLSFGIEREVIVSLGDIQDKFLSLPIRDKMIDKMTMRNALTVLRRFQLIEILDRDLSNEESCYLREFSIRHLGDSKVCGEISGVIGKIMRRFRPEYEGMDTNAVLAEYGIYKMPDYVYFKGEVRPKDRGLSAIQETEIS